MGGICLEMRVPWVQPPNLDSYVSFLFCNSLPCTHAYTYTVWVCLHPYAQRSKGHFPRCPAAQGFSVTSSSLRATRGNKEAGLSFLTPSSIQWRHTLVLGWAGKVVGRVQANCVCNGVCVTNRFYELKFWVNTNKETEQGVQVWISSTSNTELR